jgi:hypothetical protein
MILPPLVTPPAIAPPMPGDIANLDTSVQKIVTTATKDIQQSVETAGRVVQATATKAGQDVQNATAVASKEIGAIALQARTDLENLLKNIGHQADVIAAGLPDATAGNVNGEKFYTPADAYVLFMKAIAEKKPVVDLWIYEPGVVHLLGQFAASNANEFRAKLFDALRRTYNLPRDTEALISKAIFGREFDRDEIINKAAGWDDVLMVTAIFGGIATVLTASIGPIMAMGLSLGLFSFMLCLGIAFVLAVVNGYDIEDFGLTSGPDGRTSLHGTLRKRR